MSSVTNLAEKLIHTCWKNKTKKQKNKFCQYLISVINKVKFTCSVSWFFASVMYAGQAFLVIPVCWCFCELLRA